MSFRVLLVDDSPTVRLAVGDILSRNVPGLSIAGQARNGRECLDLVASGAYDLIILDVEMPEMDGIETLKELQRRGNRTPVLMLSVLTQRGAITTFRALDLGALDFIPKPSPDSGVTMADVEAMLTDRVRDVLHTYQELNTDAAAAVASGAPARTRVETGAAAAAVRELLVIGASTGGPQALQEIFRSLPGNFPAPIVVVQHMPPVFTEAFAERLNNLSALKVSEARDGQTLQAGQACVAPGARHLLVRRTSGGVGLSIDDGPPVLSHKPSIDVTLRSAVEGFGGKAAALLMTGMGRDGVEGMLALREAGGLTLAQDEASSVVFGMNRRAIEAGAVEQVAELKNIVAILSRYFS